jgi:hypothetical protein
MSRLCGASSCCGGLPSGLQFPGPGLGVGEVFGGLGTSQAYIGSGRLSPGHERVDAAQDEHHRHCAIEEADLQPARRPPKAAGRAVIGLLR